MSNLNLPLSGNNHPVSLAMFSSRFALVCIVVFCLIFPGAAQAKLSITPYGQVSARAASKSGGSSVRTHGYGLVVSNEYFSLGYAETVYDFSGSQAIDVVDTLHSIFGDFRYQDRFGEHLGYFLSLGYRFGYEEELRLDEAFNLAPRAGLHYHVNEDLVLSLGAAASLNKVRNRVSPMVGLKYRDRTSPGFSALLSADVDRCELGLNMNFSPSLGVSLSVFTHDGQYYKLDEHSVSQSQMRASARRLSPTLGGLPDVALDGVLARNPSLRRGAMASADPRTLWSEGWYRDRSTRGQLAVRYTFNEYATLNLGVHCLFARKIDLYGSSGDKVSSQRIETTWGGFGALNIRF